MTSSTKQDYLYLDLWWWDKDGPTEAAVMDAVKRNLERNNEEADTVLVGRDWKQKNGRICGLRVVVNPYISNPQNFAVGRRKVGDE